MTIADLFQAFPELETERLLLRRMHLADTGAVFSILSDPKVTRFYDDDPFTEPTQASEQIEAWDHGFQQRRCIRWGIVRKVEGAVIGSCGYYNFHGWHMRAAIGYELGSTYWRQGIMTEALGAIIDLGFRQLDLNRIEAVVMPDHVASVKLLEKLNFYHEGILRQYEQWAGKGFVDVSMLSLLNRDWRNNDI